MQGPGLKKIIHLPHIVNKEFVGIDFGSNSLKMVHAAASLNKLEIINITGSNISGLSDEDIAKTIRVAFNELKARNAYVLNIIPSHLVITKNIEIPSIDPREIRGIINLQAGRHTPYSREEIIVDYIEIGTYKNSYTKILLVIVARNIIKRQYDILQRAGLRLEKVLLGAEGLAVVSGRILKSESETNPVNIINIDETFTDFTIVFKNKPVFLRSISIGATHLLAARETYEPKFIEELKRSLEAYQSEDIEKIPSSLIITGAVEELRGLESSLNETFHLPIRYAPYLKNLPIPAQAMKTVSQARNLSFLNIAATLLALDKMKADLVPEEIKLRRSLEERARDFAKTGILVLAVFVLTFSILVSKIYFKNTYLSKLSLKYQALNEDSKKLQDNFEKINLVKSYLSSRGFSLEVLTELYNIATPELEISDIRFDELGKFTIRGTAETMSAVFSFVENLAKSKYFKDVKTKYTTKRKDGSRDVTDFEIGAALTKRAG